MANQAAHTAFGAMSVVAIEQLLPERQRVVRDDLVFRFMPPGMKALVRLTAWPPIRAMLFNLSERRARGVWGGVLCRKRYIDEKLLESLSAGIQAVVILGAGLDTRAYRLIPASTVPVFEVDVPENITYKEARLRKVFGGVPAPVHLVPLDLDRQDLSGGLRAQGYRSGDRTVFIWEGVTQYLTAEGVRMTMEILAQAQAGSRLVFTYVLKDFIEGRVRHGLDALYEAYREKRLLWHFGLEPDEVPAFLERYGWKELEQVGSQEYTTRYLKPAGRTIPVMEIERAVCAEKL